MAIKTIVREHCSVAYLDGKKKVMKHGVAVGAYYTPPTVRFIHSAFHIEFYDGTKDTVKACDVIFPSNGGIDYDEYLYDYAPTLRSRS